MENHVNLGKADFDTGREKFVPYAKQSIHSVPFDFAKREKFQPSALNCTFKDLLLQLLSRWTARKQNIRVVRFFHTAAAKPCILVKRLVLFLRDQIESLEKFGLLSQLRGVGFCQSQILMQFFQGCFCCNMAGVPQSQPTKSPKIWLFHEKIICLE